MGARWGDGGSMLSAKGYGEVVGDGWGEKSVGRDRKFKDPWHLYVGSVGTENILPRSVPALFPRH